VKQLALVLLLLPTLAFARKPQRPLRPKPAAGPTIDPSRFFATHPGLVRIYEGRTRTDAGDEPPAGASCEVLESKPRAKDAAGSVKESCSMIVGRKAKPATELTYELRKDGIWNTQVLAAGMSAPQPVGRLVLPAPLKVGASWKEPRGGVELDRTVKSAGGACKAAGRSFADCLVLNVVQKQGKNVVRRYTETYAAGVGLVEDAQWELVDVKGL
jgi:hypothetical protein